MSRAIRCPTYFKSIKKEYSKIEDIDFELFHKIIDWGEKVKESSLSDEAKNFLLEKETLNEDWNNIKMFFSEKGIEGLKVVLSFYKVLDKYKLSGRIDWLFSMDDGGTLKAILEKFLKKEFDKRKELFEKIKTKDFSIQCKNLIEWKNKVKSLKNDIEHIDKWTKFYKKYNDLEHASIKNMIDIYIKFDKPIKHTRKVLNYLYSKSLVEKLRIDAFPKEKREEFQKTDKQIFADDRKKLISHLQDMEIEKGNNFGPKKDWTELCAINAELKKKRNIHLRKLFAKAPKAILQLKPCWFMSPSSVSQYLKPRIVKFDLLIIDEASQMPPEEALGGICRADQTVVVGDNQQLPPTDFFNSKNDDDEEENIADEDSILDLFCNHNIDRCDLLWHYRSRHENLIKFSNQYFYDNKLIVFPSPKKNDGSLGVEFVFIKDAQYKRGASQNSSRSSSGFNVRERDKIIEKVSDFVEKNKNLSLGIVSMNKKQAEFIYEEIERLRKKNESINRYYEKWEKTTEPLIIKNLENVQGDERDVIFISTVYGPDEETGKVRQTFGPINKVDGYRRLNVLFTRAKRKIFLFSSMKADHIKINENSKKGVRFLKEYLNFAETGKLPNLQGNDTRNEPESDFEAEVGQVLKKNGFNDFKYQYGVAGYRIDIAIRNQKTAHYVLAIECDGATYHSTKSARDRDRLREEILKGYDWNIYRIWSTDWFNHREEEEKKLIEVIQKYIY